MELILSPTGSGMSAESDLSVPAAPEDAPTGEPIVEPAPIGGQQPQGRSEPPAVRREGPSGALDAARLERLQAKLDARKQLDEALAHSLGKRRLG